jgi:hypothetical protein
MRSFVQNQQKRSFLGEDGFPSVSQNSASDGIDRRSLFICAVFESVDGRTLPSTNFVSVTDAGGIWFTVSTRSIPRSLAWKASGSGSC